MKKASLTLAVALLTMGLVALPAQADEKKPEADKEAKAHKHDHDHAGHDHGDHSHAKDAKAGSADEAQITKTVSYGIGNSIGQNMAAQLGDSIDTAMLIQGLKDALEGKAPKYSQQQIQMAMMAFEQQMMAKAEKAATQAKGAGEKFLAENKGKEGVKVTDSGLQYKVLKEGTGKSPGATDQVRVSYKGMLTDGTVFDSSERAGGPITLAVDRVIPGWTEALQMMKEGGKWQLFIPSNLGYGERGAGGAIPPNAALVFDVELHEVIAAE